MLIFTRPSFESTTMTQSVSLTFSPFSTFHKMLLDDPWWQCHMLYRRKIYGECQNCPPQQFTYRQLVFPMVRYLGALAPGLDEGPGAGPQDCRGGVIDMAVAALRSAGTHHQQLSESNRSADLSATSPPHAFSLRWMQQWLPRLRWWIEMMGNCAHPTWKSSLSYIGVQLRVGLKQRTKSSRLRVKWWIL